MANPQLENGYTKIANELMAALTKLDISGAEFMVVLAVVAKTYGWNKKEDRISLTQFQKMTCMSRPRVIKAIRNLVRYKVLGSISGDTSKTSTYWIIKDYEKWKTGNRSDTSNRFGTRAGNSREQKLVTQQQHTKDNTKNTITKDNGAFDFETLWNQYPRPIGKKEALKRFKSSVKTEQDYKDIQTALENYKKSDRVKKNFIQNGSTWFNNWRDWIIQPEISTGPGVFRQDQDERKSKYDAITTKLRV